MRKLIYYTNGQVVIQDGAGMLISGGGIDHELDLDAVSDDDFHKICADPHNNELIDKIIHGEVE